MGLFPQRYLPRVGKAGPTPALTRNRRPPPGNPGDGEPEHRSGAAAPLIRRGLRDGAGSRAPCLSAAQRSGLVCEPPHTKGPPMASSTTLRRSAGVLISLL